MRGGKSIDPLAADTTKEEIASNNIQNARLLIIARLLMFFAGSVERDLPWRDWLWRSHLVVLP